MARRRMIGVSVFGSDTFLDLPDGAKALYPYIILNADDNGLLDNMKALARTFNAQPDALTGFINASLIIDFDNRVYAVTHWEQQNHIAPARPSRPSSLMSW